MSIQSTQPHRPGCCSCFWIQIKIHQPSGKEEGARVNSSTVPQAVLPVMMGLLWEHCFCGTFLIFFSLSAREGLILCEISHIVSDEMMWKLFMQPPEHFGCEDSMTIPQRPSQNFTQSPQVNIWL